MMLRLTILSCALGAVFVTTALAAPTKEVTRVPNPTTTAKTPVAKMSPATKAPEAIPVNLPALSAEQIIEKNVAARGGLAAWKNVHSMTMAGKMDAGRRRVDGGQYSKLRDRKQARAEMKAELRKAAMSGAEANTNDIIQLPFQMDLKRPLKSRLEIQFNGDTAVQVYDGTNGWKLRPYLGRREVEPFTPAEQKIASLQQPLDGPLIDYRAKGTKVEVLGGEKVEHRDAYKLKLTLKNGEVRQVWVDAQTFLDIKIDGAPRKVDGKPRAVATYIRDYKSVDGLMIPYTFETRVDGLRDSERILIERVALNSAPDDKRFAKPN